MNSYRSFIVSLIQIPFFLSPNRKILIRWCIKQTTNFTSYTLSPSSDSRFQVPWVLFPSGSTINRYSSASESLISRRVRRDGWTRTQVGSWKVCWRSAASSMTAGPPPPVTSAPPCSAIGRIPKLTYFAIIHILFCHNLYVDKSTFYV